MAGDYLHIIQGDDYVFSTNVAVDNVSQNISGATVSFYAIAERILQGDDPIINVDTTSGQVTVNNSSITVTLNSAFTNNVAQANVAHWYLRSQLANGSVYTLDKGRLCVVPGFAPLPL